MGVSGAPGSCSLTPAPRKAKAPRFNRLNLGNNKAIGIGPLTLNGGFLYNDALLAEGDRLRRCKALRSPADL